VWQYDDARSVQLLLGFRAVCGLCHHLMHFGLAQQLAEKGHLDLQAVIAHFTKVNGVGRAEFRAHRTVAFKTWRERSKHSWRTDLGEWSGLVSAEASEPAD
jgi:hypothetical protein